MKKAQQYCLRRKRGKVLVICGPTAIGKTSAGILLAKKFDGEIISADSRQVYRGLNIGTGKDLPKDAKFSKQFSIDGLKIGYYLIEGIPVWLLDLVSPKYQFNLADWLNCAQKVIKTLWRKGKRPIVVGGTGFYIEALVDGVDSLGIPPNQALRQQLGKLSIIKLQEKLKRVDLKVWNQLNRSDRFNPHRLIRKIEIAMSKKTLGAYKKRRLQADYLMIGLIAPRQVIYQRIDQRVKERLDAGLLEEIKKLLAQGVSWQDPGMKTLAYKEFKPFFENEKSLEEVIERWRFDEHRYARRQLTWFRKEKRINWFDITDPNWREAMVKLVQRWYSKNNYD